LIGEARWVGETDLFLSTAQGRRNTRVGEWTKGCFKCHATGPEPRTHLSPPDTRAVELGIACESCHGPARAHVDARRAGEVPTEPLVVNPTKLSPERSAAVCGQCHANFATKGRATWRREGPTFRPGELLGDDRYLVSYASEPDEDAPWLDAWLEGSPSRMDTKFWPDGSVLPGGREYSGLVESACFLEGGMTCNSCHSAHRYDSPDKMLKPDALGDAACTTGGCHVVFVGAAVAEHSHHAAESPGSRCVNCHMPPTSWGMHRAVASHRIDAPDAVDVLDNPRPNACNLCHLDRTTRWTAQTLADWYGGPAPVGPAERGAPGAGIGWLLSGHAVQRGLAAWAMGWAPARQASGADWMPSLLAEALRDPVSAVRLVAERALRLDPAYDDVPFDFTGDAEVRDGAAEAVLDVWRAAGGRRRADPHVLVGADGRRDTAAIDAMLSARDTRRIGVGE
ncbi:MAG: multiheme c-type cytochrome, partial [Myxococcota bacterium]